MNWREWYDTMPKLTESEARISVISWDKCKEEVLKILKKDKFYEVINSGIVKEIEKL